MATKPVHRWTSDRPGMRLVINAAANVLGYSIDDLMSEKKHVALVSARHVAYAAGASYGHSFGHIGRMIDRDHTSVMHGIAKAQQHEDCADKVAAIRAEVERLIERDKRRASVSLVCRKTYTGMTWWELGGR